MATATPPADNSTVRPASQPLRVPPDDTIWKKYSPHHEAPLSFVGSFATHILVLALLFMWGFLAYLFFNSEPKDLPIEAIHMGGGGGKHNAKGNGSGPNIVGPEDPSNPPTEPVANEEPLASRPPLDVEESKTIKAELSEDPTATRFIESGNENMKMLARLDKEVRDKLRQGINPGAAPGRGGDGTGGGRGSGDGTGTGPGKGAGRMLNKREERMLRWSMSFDTHNGLDYLNQLRDLGAIIAVPTPSGEYKTCDLAKGAPYQFATEDLSNIKRIYWVDDKPESVQALMSALRFPGRPANFVAFMPESLETKLFDLELKYKNLKEEQIYETKFKCIKRGLKYDVIVLSQTPK